jgi:hypothetical protein
MVAGCGRFASISVFPKRFLGRNKQKEAAFRLYIFEYINAFPTAAPFLSSFDPSIATTHLLFNVSALPSPSSLIPPHLSSSYPSADCSLDVFRIFGQI